MNYVSLLNEEEIKVLCKIVSGKDFKTLFNNNSKEFAKIKPGFRSNKLSDDDAVSLAVKNINKDFISNFVNSNVEHWLKDIGDNKSKLCLLGEEDENALAESLYKSVLSNNVNLYFKLKEEKVDDVYLDKLKKLILAQQDTTTEFSNVDIDIVKISETLNSHELKKEEDEIEIEKFRACEKFDDTEKDKSALNVQGYDYISLCEVELQYDGSILLNRLADIEKTGLIQKFYVNEEIPKYYANRTKLFYKNGPKESGVIGVWDWSCEPSINDYSKDYHTTNYDSKIRPIEIINMQNCKSFNEVIDILKDGFEIKLTANRILFGICLTKDRYSGFLCKTGDFERIGNKIKLREDVICLPQYNFTGKEIIELSNRRTYFNSIVIGMPSELIRVKNPIDVVRTVILDRTSWNIFKQQGKSRNEWKNFKDFIENLDVNSIVDDIAKVTYCTKSEAQSMLNDFMEQIGNYIDAKTVEDGIIAAAINANSELMDRCKALVREDWINENKDEVNKANAELEELNKKIEQKLNQYNEEKHNYDKLSAKFQDLKDNISSKEQFASEVEQEVEKRIHQAQSNAAEFVAGLAFIPRAEVGLTDVKALSNVLKTKTYEDVSRYYSGLKLELDQVEKCNTWKETLVGLEIELIDSGVSEQYAYSLAAYMYAAYLNKSCLLMIGPNGGAIVDAFSRAVFGRRAGCLRCTEKYDATSLEECLHSEDEVVNIVDPFSSGWVTYIPRLLNSSIVNSGHKYFIATYPYVEDIQLEPKSTYNYMLPIFTELFVEKLPDEIDYEDKIGGLCAENFEEFTLKKVSNIHNKLLMKMHTSPLAKTRIQNILSYMHEMLKNDKNMNYDVIFALFPYAYATMQTSLFLEAIQQDIENESNSELKDLLKQIKVLYGENE